ncbi:MAG: SDR family NAD(P)-dependent oxidoreductase [Pseudomonadota bacterium]
MSEKSERNTKRRWFITGAGKGLGAALSEEVVRRGDDLIGLVRTPEDAANIEALNSLNGGAATAHMGDVTDSAGMRQAIDALERSGSQVDILVNNAGYGLLGAAEEVSETELRALFDVNVFGAFNAMHAVLPHMRARREGHIINITSVSGLAPWAGTTAYTASKYALEGIGQTLQGEVAELGIHVTNVAPGALRTKFGTSSLRTAERTIEDYSGAAHEPRRGYAATGGKEAGDPGRAATAIFNVTREPVPPLHLLLGADALKYYELEQARINGEIDQYRDVSLSIAFDD